MRAALGIALAYAIVLLVSPALHDAGDCFHNTPEHCVACLANPAAANVQAATGPARADLLPAERVESSEEERAGAVLSVETPGRAPPAC